MSLTRRWQGFVLKLKRVYRQIVRASGTPHQIALGVAVGFFVGWLPIIGIQMVVAVTVCTFLKCNRVVPLFPIWLTNPATAVPIYSFNYWVGWLVVGGPGMDKVKGAIGGLIPKPGESGVNFFPNPAKWAYEWGAEFLANAKHNLSALLELGWEMQLPLWLGCVIVGLALAVPSYYLARYGVQRFENHVFHKRRLRQERLAAHRGKTDPGGEATE